MPDLFIFAAAEECTLGEFSEPTHNYEGGLLFGSTPLSFDDAQSACQMCGGILVQPLNASEAEEVLNFAIDSGIESQGGLTHFWIGLERIPTNQVLE